MLRGRESMTAVDEYVQRVNDMTVAEVTSRITTWLERAKSGASVEELMPDVTQLCHSIPFETLRITRNTKFFRARTAAADTYFQNATDLWYPPAAAVRTLGRANQVGAPMLYVAQDGRTAIFESSPSRDQHIAIAEIGLNDGMSLNLQHVGVFNNLSSGNLSEVASLYSQRLAAHGYTENGINNVAMIHRLLGEEFMRDVAPGNEHEYSVSVAIANFYLSYDDADGLMFPSKRSPNDYNIVFKSASADAKLFVKRIYGVQAIETSSTEVAFRYWKASTDITDDGEIIWGPGPELPPLDWNSAGYPALQGPFKKSPRPIDDPAT